MSACTASSAAGRSRWRAAHSPRPPSVSACLGSRSAPCPTSPVTNCSSTSAPSSTRWPRTRQSSCAVSCRCCRRGAVVRVGARRLRQQCHLVAEPFGRLIETGPCGARKKAADAHAPDALRGEVCNPHVRSHQKDIGRLRRDSGDDRLDVRRILNAGSVRRLLLRPPRVRGFLGRKAGSGAVGQQLRRNAADEDEIHEQRLRWLL